MLSRTVRAFGLLFGGSVCIIGGGGAAVYGLITLYFAPPGGRAPGEVLAPVNETAAVVLTSELTAIAAVVGTAGFVWEVRKNGLLEGEERLRAERVEEMRRELAQEREAWQPPEGERTEPSVYDELREEASQGLVLVAHEMVGTDPPRVRGVVGNTGKTATEEIRVRVRFEGDGGTVGTGIATRKALQPGERWEFEIFHREDAEEVRSYRIGEPVTAADE